MSFFIFQFYIYYILFQDIISKYQIVMNEICKSKIKIDYSNNNNFVLETLRGKINLKFENTYLNNCDTNFIQEINKNIPCPYLIIDINDFYNKTLGLYLGAGINLLNHDYKFFISLYFGLHIVLAQPSNDSVSL